MSQFWLSLYIEIIQAGLLPSFGDLYKCIHIKNGGYGDDNDDNDNDLSFLAERIYLCGYYMHIRSRI